MRKPETEKSRKMGSNRLELLQSVITVKGKKVDEAGFQLLCLFFKKVVYKMNYSKKHLKIALFVPLSKNTTYTNKKIGMWYGQIEKTELKKNRPNGLNKCSEARMK